MLLLLLMTCTCGALATLARLGLSFLERLGGAAGWGVAGGTVAGLEADRDRVLVGENLVVMRVLSVVCKARRGPRRCLVSLCSRRGLDDSSRRCSCRI